MNDTTEQEHDALESWFETYMTHDAFTHKTDADLAALIAPTFAVLADARVLAERERVLAEVETLAGQIDEYCPHEPDEHAEGTCDVCDLAFAAAGLVTALVARLRDPS